METNPPALTTSTTSLDSLRPPFEQPIEYQVPSSSNNNNSFPDQDHHQTFSSSSASSHTIQPSHASQSFTFFPPSPSTGFIKALVINRGFTLELRWISTIKVSTHSSSSDHLNPLLPLDRNGSHQPIHLHFNDRIIPNPFITITNDASISEFDHHHHPSESVPAQDPDQGSEEDQEQILIILVLTENYTLYRIKFRYPSLFYSELFDEDWTTDYEVEEILNRQVLLTHGIDSNNLIISCSDGILTHLSWGKLIGINQNYGWKTSNLTPHRSSILGLLNLLPSSWSNPSSSKTISSSAHEWIATPSSTISVANHLPVGATGEDAWLFTISRDRKLKVWSLTTGFCLKELSLKPSSSDHHHSTTDNQSDLQNSLLPAAPRTLARFIYSEEGDDPSYEGFLVVFVPSPVSPSFVTYGLSMSTDNQFRDLVLLEERPCDWNRDSRPKMGELRDFQISKVDLSISFTTSPSKQTPWGLWAVWDDDLGGQGILQYTVLHETRNWQESTRTQWVTIQSPDRRAPWNSTYFDELLANDPSSSVTEVFVDHLFRPGHFSFSDLEYALDTYEDSLRSDPQSNPDLDLLDNSVYESLHEKICTVVGSNVQLEISNVTGIPMIEAYHRKLRIEWLKFATMCSESRASSLWPLELAVDADRQQVYINGRRSITTPVLIDTATLLCQLVEHLNDGKKPRLLEHQVTEIDRFHPLLSNLNNRIDLVSLVNAINSLVDGLLHGQIIKPFEDDLTQIVRRPIKFSIADVVQDLFNRRLDPFIDDGLDRKVSEQLSQIKDLELAFQMLWNILSTCELVGSDLDEGVVGDNGTILTQMLMTDYLVNAMERRYEMCRNTILFLTYLYGEENTDELFNDLPSLMSQYLVSFQQSSMSRWLCRQCSKIPGELAFEVEDKLVDKLTELHVSTTQGEVLGNPQGVMITEANSAISMLSSLLLTRFTPELNPGLKLPGSIAEASSKFLDDAGLFKNLRRLSDDELSRIRLIETEPKLVELGYFFLKVDLVSVGLEWAQMIPDSGCGVEYVKGLAYLKSGLIEDAENCFVRAGSAIYDENFEVDDQSGLRLILPETARRSLEDYFSYVVSLFEPIGANQSVAKFCQLAIDGSLDQNAPCNGLDLDDQAVVDHELLLVLWIKLFKAYVNLGLWDDAYEALISIPSLESQHDCLRTLVSNMCESNEVDRLLRFSWLGLQNEFEKTISFRARNSDPLSVPNYFAILYAYHLNRGDYRSAAIAMYQHGRKVGEIAIKGGAFQFLLTQQCQSYLAAINSLSLVPEKHAWIPISCLKFGSTHHRVSYGGDDPNRYQISMERIRRRKRVTYFVPETEFTAGTRDIEVLKLDDIREEYTLVLSRLQLANELPQLSQPGSTTITAAYLDGDTVVPMFLNQGRVTEALEKATVLGTDLIPIFNNLTESCCRLTIEGEEGGNLFDSQWVNGDPIGSDWDGNLVSKAWRLLQVHLEHMFPIKAIGDLSLKGWRCRESILECILKSNRAVKVPVWLLDQFMKFKPDRLLRLFFRFDLLSDAFTVAIHIIDHVEQSMAKDSSIISSISKGKIGDGVKEAVQNIPFTDLDRLLNLTSEDLKKTRRIRRGGSEGLLVGIRDSNGIERSEEQKFMVAGGTGAGVEEAEEEDLLMDPIKLSSLQSIVKSKLNQILHDHPSAKLSFDLQTQPLNLSHPPPASDLQNPQELVAR